MTLNNDSICINEHNQTSGRTWNAVEFSIYNRT